MGHMEYRGTKGHGAARIGNFAGLADGETITIGDLLLTGKRYEFRAAGPATGSNILVLKGANAAAAIAAFVAAVNANKPAPAVTAYVDPVDTAVARIETDKQADAGLLAFLTTMLDAANVIAAESNKLAGAESARNQLLDRGEYLVKAIDISAGNIMIPTSHGTPRYARWECIDTNGGKKAITWRGTISNNRLKITTNGATPPIAGDRILWEIYE
jgi:hypothetical protein